MILLTALDLVHPGPLLASVAEVGQLYQLQKRTRLIEPDAGLVILIVVGVLALAYFSH